MDCSENEDAEHKEWFEGIMKMRKEMEEGKTQTPIKMYYEEDIMSVGLWLYMYTDLFHLNHEDKKWRSSARMISMVWMMMVMFIIFL